MSGNISEIHMGGDILLLGRYDGLLAVPENMREAERAAMMLRRVMRNGDAMRQIRATWSRWTSHPMPWIVSDEDVYRLIEQDLDRGKLQGVALPHVWMSHAGGKATALQRSVRPTSGQRGLPGAGSVSPSPTASPFARATAADISSSSANATAQRPPVSQWSVADKLKTLIEKTIRTVDPHAGQVLVGLLSADSLDAVQVTLSVVAETGITNFSWASDVVLACIAFGFGGVEGLEAVEDLAEALRKTARAQTEVDLDHGARLLKRAADDLGALGLMAVIYKIGSRIGTGSHGQEGSAQERDYGPVGKSAKTTSTPSESRKSSSSSNSPPPPPPPKKSPDAAGAAAAAAAAAAPDSGADTANYAKEQAAALQAAAASGVPFCEECARRGGR